MFVRWVVRKHKNADIANVTFHDAYLMESFRNEDGNPRQRTVTYLGNIRQIDEQFPTIERELFLLRAENILATTPEVSPADAKQAMQQLQETVQPLDADEVMVGFQNTLRWYTTWWRDNKQLPVTTSLRKQIESVVETLNQLLREE
ncbi:MAG: hypothetical protein AAFQ07_09285 [Chloroflexota bacterium]